MHFISMFTPRFHYHPNIQSETSETSETTITRQMAVRPLVELSKTDSDEQTHQQLTCDAKATNPNRQVPLVSFIFLLEFCKLTGKQRFTFRLDRESKVGFPHLNRLTPPFPPRSGRPLPHPRDPHTAPWWGNGCRNTSRTSAWSRATWAP